MVKYGKVLQTACKTGSRRGPWVHRGICRVQEWFNPIPWRLVDRTPKQCNGHLAGKLRYRIIWMENIEHPATGLIKTHTAHRKLHQRSSILCPHSLLAIEHQALENTSAKSSKSPKSPGRLIVLGTWMHAAPSGKGGCSGTSPCETRGVSPAAQVITGLSGSGTYPEGNPLQKGIAAQDVRRQHALTEKVPECAKKGVPRPKKLDISA